MTPRSAATHSGPAVFLTFALAVAAMSLPLGSHRDWIWPAFTILYCVLGMLVLRSPAGTREIIYQHRISIIGSGFLIVWIGIQAWGLGPLLEPVSIDHAMTRLDWYKTVAYGCVLILTICLLDRESRVRTLIYAVLMVALGQATFGIVGTLNGLQQSARGTFPNPNHLAGLLEMSLGLGIGLMIAMQTPAARRPRSGDRLVSWLHVLTGPRGRLRLVLLILVIGLVMSSSRTGNVAFLCSILITSGLMLAITRQMARMTAVFLISILVIDVAIIGHYFGLERIAKRLEGMAQQANPRGDINRVSLTMLRDHWLAGTGSGTYEVAFAPYRQQDIGNRVSNAENDYLEFLIELGLIGSIPLLLLLIAGIRAMILLARRPAQFGRGIAFGCMTATVSMLIHSAADFNLQIPSNAVLFIVILGLPQALLWTSAMEDKPPLRLESAG
jgi:putative inorganic carbon (HCO3(-)) transporter